jgi:hypothetical protein
LKKEKDNGNIQDRFKAFRGRRSIIFIDGVHLITPQKKLYPQILIIDYFKKISKKSLIEDNIFNILDSLEIK